MRELVDGAREEAVARVGRALALAQDDPASLVMALEVIEADRAANARRRRGARRAARAAWRAGDRAEDLEQAVELAVARLQLPVEDARAAARRRLDASLRARVGEQFARCHFEAADAAAAAADDGGGDGGGGGGGARGGLGAAGSPSAASLDAALGAATAAMVDLAAAKAEVAPCFPPRW